MFVEPVHLVGVIQARQGFSVESLERASHNSRSVFQTLAHLADVDFGGGGRIESTLQRPTAKHSTDDDRLNLYTGAKKILQSVTNKYIDDLSRF